MFDVIQRSEARYRGAYTFEPPKNSDAKELRDANIFQKKVWSMLDDALEMVQGDVHLKSKNNRAQFLVPRQAVKTSEDTVSRQEFTYSILDVPYFGKMFVDPFIKILRNPNVSIDWVPHGSVLIPGKKNILW